MIETNYVYFDKKVNYEIKKDGYCIYLDDVLWIKQLEPFIPYPDLGYEGSCLKQLEELFPEQVDE